MTRQKTERAYIRISPEDKRMVNELARKLNLDASQVWRLAIKRLHEQEIKPR